MNYVSRELSRYDYYDYLAARKHAEEVQSKNVRSVLSQEDFSKQITYCRMAECGRILDPERAYPHEHVMYIGGIKAPFTLEAATRYCTNYVETWKWLLTLRSTWIGSTIGLGIALIHDKI